MKEPVYEVFARKTREEPLRHIGFINAIDPALARICASTTYDEQNWFEMCLVPRAAIMPVTREGGTSEEPIPEELAALLRAAGAGSYGGDEVATSGGGGGMTSSEAPGGGEGTVEIPGEARQALRNLLLALADNKRLLGMRYSDCMLGSPSLETGIAT